MLPPKYRLLLKKQTYLDLILSNITNEHQYQNILNHFNDYHIHFTTDDFEKILHIAPFYYIYQSKMKLNGTIDLICIDIPVDFEKRMKVKLIIYLFF